MLPLPCFTVGVVLCGGWCSVDKVFVIMHQRVTFFVESESFPCLILFLMLRVSCEKASSYNVEQFERTRDSTTNVPQKSTEKDNNTPEDETEAQDTGAYVIVTVILIFMTRMG